MPSAPDRGARDTWFVVAVIAVVVLITVTPALIGHARATPARHFVGPFTPDVDTNVYYAFIAQVRDGAWLFENRFTTTPHPARLLNVQWLTVGLVGRVTGWPNEALNELWHLAGVALLLGAFWRLTAHVVTGTWPRRIALIAFATGAGFGWALLVLRQIGVAVPWDHFQWAARFRTITYDLYVGTPFRVLTGGFHALSFGLFVYGLERFITGERDGRRGAYVACAAAALALALSHPYEAMTLAATVVIAIAARARVGLAAAQPLAYRALPVITTGAGVLYMALLLARYPVYRWGASAPFPPHLPLHQLVAFGIAGLLALWNVRAFFRRAATGEPAHLVVASAFVANVALYYSFPLLWFSGNFRTTLMAQVLVIAVAPLTTWWPHITRRAGGIALVALLLVVNAGSSAVAVARDVVAVWNPDGPRYVDAGLIDMARWLRGHRAPGDAALASVALGAWLPAHAGVRLYAGDVAPTPELARRAEEVRTFFDSATPDPERVTFLRAHRVRWIVVTPAERAFAPDEKYLARRFDAGGYGVWEVAP